MITVTYYSFKREPNRKVGERNDQVFVCLCMNDLFPFCEQKGDRWFTKKKMFKVINNQ